LDALWKKHTTFPSFAYAGIPYQVLGQRDGAFALMIAWRRFAMVRSGSFNAPIAARAILSPSALSLSARASALSSWARAFIASRSTSVNPLSFLFIEPALPAEFRVFFFGLIDRSFCWDITCSSFSPGGRPSRAGQYGSCGNRRWPA